MTQEPVSAGWRASQIVPSWLIATAWPAPLPSIVKMPGTAVAAERLPPLERIPWIATCSSTWPELSQRVGDHRVHLSRGSVKHRTGLAREINLRAGKIEVHQVCNQVDGEGGAGRGAKTSSVDSDDFAGCNAARLLGGGVHYRSDARLESRGRRQRRHGRADNQIGRGIRLGDKLECRFILIPKHELAVCRERLPPNGVRRGGMAPE